MLDSFRRSTREIEQYLGNVISIERMRTREVPERGGARIARYDELFQFIRFCITGENHPVRLPEIPMYLDWLATAELDHGLTPESRKPVPQRDCDRRFAGRELARHLE